MMQNPLHIHETVHLCKKVDGQSDILCYYCGGTFLPSYDSFVKNKLKLSEVISPVNFQLLQQYIKYLP